MTKVLFICASNSVRSPMAEGWARHLGGDNISVRSAGISPYMVHPLAVATMQEIGIDIGSRGNRLLDDQLLKWADYAITLSDTVKPYSTYFPDTLKYDHWSIPNPDTLVSDEISQEKAYAQVRDNIGRRVEQFLQKIKG